MFKTAGPTSFLNSPNNIIVIGMHTYFHMKLIFKKLVMGQPMAKKLSVLKP